MRNATNDKKMRETQAAVYCPMCTHTVEARVAVSGRVGKVVAGQKCSRCTSPLDAAYVWQLERAA